MYEVKALVTCLCSTLWNPMDCSPPGFSVHGILQARILEWVAIPFSGGSSQPRDQTQVFYIAGRFFTTWASREAPVCVYLYLYNAKTVFSANHFIRFDYSFLISRLCILYKFLSIDIHIMSPQ